eukprot:g2289.t1
MPVSCLPLFCRPSFETCLPLLSLNIDELWLQTEQANESEGSLQGLESGDVAVRARALLWLLRQSGRHLAGQRWHLLRATALAEQVRQPEVSQLLCLASLRTQHWDALWAGGRLAPALLMATQAPGPLLALAANAPHTVPALLTSLLAATYSVKSTTLPLLLPLLTSFLPSLARLSPSTARQVRAALESFVTCRPLLLPLLCAGPARLGAPPRRVSWALQILLDISVEVLRDPLTYLWPLFRERSMTLRADQNRPGAGAAERAEAPPAKGAAAVCLSGQLSTRATGDEEAEAEVEEAAASGSQQPDTQQTTPQQHTEPEPGPRRLCLATLLLMQLKRQLAVRAAPAPLLAWLGSELRTQAHQHGAGGGLSGLLRFVCCLQELAAPPAPCALLSPALLHELRPLAARASPSLALLVLTTLLTAAGPGLAQRARHTPQTAAAANPLNECWNAFHACLAGPLQEIAAAVADAPASNSDEREVLWVSGVGPGLLACLLAAHLEPRTQAAVLSAFLWRTQHGLATDDLPLALLPTRFAPNSAAQPSAVLRALSALLSALVPRNDLFAFLFGLHLRPARPPCRGFRAGQAAAEAFRTMLPFGIAILSRTAQEWDGVQVRGALRHWAHCLLLHWTPPPAPVLSALALRAVEVLVALCFEQAAASARRQFRALSSHDDRLVLPATLEQVLTEAATPEGHLRVWGQPAGLDAHASAEAEERRGESGEGPGLAGMVLVCYFLLLFNSLCATHGEEGIAYSPRLLHQVPLHLLLQRVRSLAPARWSGGSGGPALADGADGPDAGADGEDRCAGPWAEAAPLERLYPTLLASVTHLFPAALSLDTLLSARLDRPAVPHPPDPALLAALAPCLPAAATRSQLQLPSVQQVAHILTQVVENPLPVRALFACLIYLTRCIFLSSPYTRRPVAHLSGHPWLALSGQPHRWREFVLPRDNPLAYVTVVLQCFLPRAVRDHVERRVLVLFQELWQLWRLVLGFSFPYHTLLCLLSTSSPHEFHTPPRAPALRIGQKGNGQLSAYADKAAAGVAQPEEEGNDDSVWRARDWAELELRLPLHKLLQNPVLALEQVAPRVWNRPALARVLLQVMEGVLESSRALFVRADQSRARRAAFRGASANATQTYLAPPATGQPRPDTTGQHKPAGNSPGADVGVQWWPMAHGPVARQDQRANLWPMPEAHPLSPEVNTLLLAQESAFVQAVLAVVTSLHAHLRTLRPAASPALPAPVAQAAPVQNDIWTLSLAEWEAASSRPAAAAPAAARTPPRKRQRTTGGDSDATEQGATHSTRSQGGGSEAAALVGAGLVSEVSQAVLHTVHRLFIANPLLLKLVHFQGYSLSTLPLAMS